MCEGVDWIKTAIGEDPVTELWEHVKEPSSFTNIEISLSLE
jgi:hypothetical protein